MRRSIPATPAARSSNALGEVIGDEQLASSRRAAARSGLGFAIPINRVKRVVGRSARARRRARGRGSASSSSCRSSRESARRSLTQRCVVGAVVPGSPADARASSRGDVILREGSRAVRNPFDWEAALLDLRVGEHGAARASSAAARAVDVDCHDRRSARGRARRRCRCCKELELVTVTPAIRVRAAIRSARGALIYNVSASRVGRARACRRAT